MILALLWGLVGVGVGVWGVSGGGVGLVGFVKDANGDMV